MPMSPADFGKLRVIRTANIKPEQRDRRGPFRMQRRVLGAELDAIGVHAVEGEVEAQHRHVHEYDAREQNPAHRDPEDPAAGPCLLLAAAAGLGADARARERFGDGHGYPTFVPTRRRAD